MKDKSLLSIIFQLNPDVRYIYNKGGELNNAIIEKSKIQAQPTKKSKKIC